MNLTRGWPWSAHKFFKIYYYFLVFTNRAEALLESKAFPNTFMEAGSGTRDPFALTLTFLTNTSICSIFFFESSNYYLQAKPFNMIMILIDFLLH